MSINVMESRKNFDSVTSYPLLDLLGISTNSTHRQYSARLNHSEKHLEAALA